MLYADKIEKNSCNPCSDACYPVILYPLSGENLLALSIVVGRAHPCSFMTLFVDEKPVDKFYADRCGGWQIKPDLLLDAGIHELIVSDGCHTSGSIRFTIESSSPVQPPVIFYPSGIIEENNPVIRGIGLLGTSTRVCVDGENCKTVPVEEDGGWSWAYPGSLKEGMHTVTAVTITQDGKESSVVSQTFQVETAHMLRNKSCIKVLEGLSGEY